MTYGWALVVIVIVVAALVLLVGNPAQGADTCSNPGSGFNITNSDLNSGTGWTIKSSNITGRSITLKDCTANGGPWVIYSPGAGTITAGPGAPRAVASGQAITFWANASAGTAGTRYTTSVIICYNDGDFDRNVSFNCSGTN